MKSYSFLKDQVLNFRCRIALLSEVWFSANGGNNLTYVFTYLNGWNVFHFPVFVLCFKNVSNNVASQSNFRALLLFSWSKMISWTKQTEANIPLATFQRWPFFSLCSGCLRRSLQYVHSSLVKFRCSRCWSAERYFFTWNSIFLTPGWLRVLVISFRGLISVPMK